MSRIHLEDPNLYNGSELEQYNRFPTNLVRAMLRTKASTKAYISLGASFLECGLTDKDRELVIMRVGALSNSAYERMQHLELAFQAGWSDEDIGKIENGLPINDRSNAILAYVNECVADVKVSEATFLKVRSYYSETQVADLTLLIGHYMMTARFLETLEVDLDEGPGDRSNVGAHG